MPTDSDNILILLRHAKAARPVGVPDLQRPLAERGLVDAAAAGRWLAEQNLHPVKVLCSPSRRTRETWDQVATELPGQPEVVYAEDLYDAGPAELLDLLRSLEPQVTKVLVIGHNPTMELLAALLDPEHVGRMPTAAISVHHQPGPWAELGARSAEVTATHVARG